MPAYPTVHLERVDTSPHTAHQFDPEANRTVHWPEATFNRPSIAPVSQTLARKLLVVQGQNFRLAAGETLPELPVVAEPAQPDVSNMSYDELAARCNEMGIEIPKGRQSKASLRELIAGRGG